MKITEIHVDRFGVWRNVSFPLHANGLNVVYGPNEAGKSTLMRFIRSVLYGFDATIGSPAKGAEVWDGSLTVLHDGKSCRVQRAWRHGTRGFVSIDGPDADLPGQHVLSGLLANTDETLFKSVFAVGLQELQELATLNDEQVAGHVYGLSLGPEGQRLLEVTDEVRRRRDQFLDENTESGDLAELLARDEDLSLQLEDAAHDRHRHAELCDQRRALEAEIVDLKKRQTGIRSQLRGHLFLERIWSPWNDVQQFETEISAIPRVVNFPEGGKARLEDLDNQITAANAERTQLLARIKDLRTKAVELQSSPKVRRRLKTMRNLVKRRQAVESSENARVTLDGDVRKHRELLDLHLAELGHGWSPDRLATVDTSPAAAHRALHAARAYQSAAGRRQRLLHRHGGLKKASQRKSLELAEQLKALGGTSLPEELTKTRARIGQVQTHGALHLRETELELQLSGIRRNIARLEAREAIPSWVAFLLVFLLIAGALIAALGFVAALTLNGIAGTALVFVGLTGCGIGYGMKRHGEIETDEELDQLREQSRTVEVQLRETREAMKNAAGGLELATMGEPKNHAELIGAAGRRLFELEQIGAADSKIQSQRRRLSEKRVKLREAHRRLCDARQNWCEFVVGIGLPETVKVDEAFAAWQRVGEARDAHSNWQQAAAEAGRRRRVADRFRKRCERLAQALSLGSLEGVGTLAMLDAFSCELQTADERRKLRTNLLREVRQCRQTVRRLNAKLSQARREWSALLVKGGAADRDEFLARAAHAARRKELEECLLLAQAELETAASTEPDLAIVEEDLQAYNREHNTDYIEVLQREQDDLEIDLQHAYEQLGSIKQAIGAMEADRRSTRLRFERAQLRHELKQTMERWLALNLAGRAVDGMRTRFERTCQPPTLAAAGEFLQQLTAGRYSTIWTPLGKHHLCIDDDRGNSFRVEQLSNGTREQLFLAIRFAMVRDFSRRGIELPLVLDDILVNFDQERTEAAVESLMKFVEGGQQVLLFTCHLHLAQIFQSKGIEPTWLPGHKPAIEERLAG